jgi:hypothetical protein
VRSVPPGSEVRPMIDVTNTAVQRRRNGDVAVRCSGRRAIRRELLCTPIVRQRLRNKLLKRPLMESGP